MTKRQIYKQILNEYDGKRSAAQLAAESQKKEIYDVLPRVKELDDTIASEGFKAVFAALKRPEEAAEFAKSYKQKCDAMLKEKNAMLKEAGIQRKYLAPRYECKECHDTGYIGVNECKCLKRKRNELIYNSYRLKERLESETFDNFDFRYYSSKKDAQKGVSPKKHMENIVSFCLKYTKNFDKKKESLLFYGSPGLGKTFLCNAMAKELIDSGYIVAYTTAFSLFSTLNDIQFGRAEEDEGRRFIEETLNADLLIIDDIGTEFSTVLTGTGFFNIINARALDNSPVIISTNLLPDDLKEMYSERIYSRITGTYKLFEFFGEDVRPLKKYGHFLD